MNLRNEPTTSIDLPGIGAWPHPGEPRRAARDDRSGREGGPAASLLTGAAWISFPEPEVPPKTLRPAYEFRKSFELAARPDIAELAVTAHGIYEAFLNGVRVGDGELTPGPSAYHARLYVQSYDVTNLLAAGANELRLVLSDGWFRGQTGYGRAADHAGTRTAVLARLTGQASGSAFDVVTDTTWQTAASSILAADLMEGETHDLRRLGREDWVAAVASDDLLCTDWSRLDVSPAPPIRRLREFPAVSIQRLASGRQIVDFGQNINGWVRLTNLGDAGTETVLHHAEHLRPEDGDVDLEAFAAIVHVSGDRLSPGQRDAVISRGIAGDVFEPRHSTKGFRYVAVDGRDDDLSPSELTAIEVRSDLARAGWFACSDEDLNRFHAIAYDTWRANSCGVPTDCPTRERAGFTGDYQIFVGTAAYLEDVEGFSRHWLQALAGEQFGTGVVPNVVPVAGDPGWEMPFSFEGSAGWGDAAAIVPWELYQAYGDTDVLAAMYPVMRRWVDHVAEVTANFRHQSKAAQPVRDHDRYLWDAGFHWGEWLEPGQQWNPTDDHGVIATAYFEHSARLVARVAGLLDDGEAARDYEALADRVRDAWRTEYWRDSRVHPESQANYVRGLRFGLVPDHQRDAAVERLVQLVHDAGDHLTTGFLSTPWLLPVLADAGHADLAYRVLRQRDVPGWLVMLDRGATTVWEAWEGVHDDGTAEASLSHYSKGGVIDFFHSHIAGLRRLEPGWRRFLVKPVPGEGITWASAALNARSGRIEVEWHLTDGAMTATVVVPVGATARVELPGAEPVELGPGTHIVS